MKTEIEQRLQDAAEIIGRAPIEMELPHPADAFREWINSPIFKSLDRDHAHMATWGEARKPLLAIIAKLKDTLADERLQRRLLEDEFHALYRDWQALNYAKGNPE